MKRGLDYPLTNGNVGNIGKKVYFICHVFVIELRHRALCYVSAHTEKAENNVIFGGKNPKSANFVRCFVLSCTVRAFSAAGYKLIMTSRVV
jgi:hypothetical protein